MTENPAGAEPVTEIFTRIIKPDRIQDFETWLKDINQAIKQFEGYLGMDVIRPGNRIHPEYVVILRFAGYDQLKQWEESPVRREWVEKSADMTVGEVTIQRRQGADIWFTSPEQGSAVPRPAWYKMTVLTIAGIYPVLVIISNLLAPLLSGLHPLLSSFINVTFIAPIVTHAVMPLLTRTFHSWLYPQPVVAQG